MLQVKETICWGLADAVGVPLDSCQVSWKLTASQAAAVQTACQVQLLDRQGSIIYDSQRVETVQSHGFMAEGLSLEESECYFVRVRVWDQQDAPSDWGVPCRIITGLRLEDCNAPFIYSDEDGIDPQTDTIRFRRDFTLSGGVRLAVIHVGSIGYHELYINGKKAGKRLLSPVRSQLTAQKQVVKVVSYEVTELLQEGENTIGLWTDAGWARCEKVAPAFFCRLSVKSESEAFSILSDLDWRCAKAPISHIGGFGWSDFGGEQVIGLWDDLAWCMPAREDTVTHPVKSVSVTPKLLPELTDGDGILSELTPLQLTNNNGTVLVDMGVNYTGWLEVRLHGGKSGDCITIQAADKPEDQVTFQQISEYLLTDPEGRFCNKFNYFSGRYFTISGLREPLKPEDITGYRIGSLLKKSGDFACEEPIISRIYQTDVDTFVASTLNGISVDCPHRERLGYGETGISTLWGIGLHAFEAGAFYRSYFQSWRESQEPSGYLPHVTPNSNGGGGTAWSSCLTIALYDAYCYYADRQLLDENFEAVRGWADFLIHHTEEGVLQRYPEDNNDWGFLGDWATPEGDDWGHSENAAFFNNCVAAYTLSLTAELAGELGRPQEEEKYRACCQAMRQAIHRKYWQGEPLCYLKGEQRYLAVALCAGIMPEEEKKSVVARLSEALRQKGHFDSGSAGTTFLFRAALENGLRDEVYQILLSKEYPGYGYFIEQGQTTWPEMWDMRDVYGGSRIHTCYTGVAGWITRGLCGITPQKYGMQEMTITPYFPEQLDALTAEYDYGYGKVKVAWRREQGRIVYNVETPPNTRTQLILTDSKAVGEQNRVKSLLLPGEHTFVLQQSAFEECARI